MLKNCLVCGMFFIDRCDGDAVICEICEKNLDWYVFEKDEFEDLGDDD